MSDETSPWRATGSASKKALCRRPWLFEVAVSWSGLTLSGASRGLPSARTLRRKGPSKGEGRADLDLKLRFAGYRKKADGRIEPNARPLQARNRRPGSHSHGPIFHSFWSFTAHPNRRSAHLTGLKGCGEQGVEPPLARSLTGDAWVKIPFSDSSALGRKPASLALTFRMARPFCVVKPTARLICGGLSTLYLFQCQR